MLNKTLIAYYSWSGHTAALAKQLQALTNADMYEIQVPTDTFSKDMYKTSDIAKAQLQAGQLPSLVQKLPDYTNYETILVGGPVWSGAPATPVLSFLTTLKNTDALLAPFYTDAGNAGDYEKTFRQAAGEHSVVGGLGLSNNRVASAQTQIKQWLNQF